MMGKQDAGREGVQYEVTGSKQGLRLYYPPQTQAAIGRKGEDGQMAMELHPIGPPDGCMAKIWLDHFSIDTDDHEEVRDVFEFGLDRECVPVLDQGGPWVRESRDLEQLNKYLSLFGIKVSMVEDEEEGFCIEVETMEPKEPHEFCDHETDFYLLEVMDVQFVDEGYAIEAEVPCGRCGIKKSIKFEIPEDVDNWDEDNED
jgi:hypothetical protein